MDDFWFDMAELWVGTFFYGVYLVLFCVCILILLRRPRNLGNTVLLVTAIALFTLCTVQAVINLILGTAEIEDVLSDSVPLHNLIKAGDIIYGVNNIIADGLVIYRCYIVWDRNVYVIILPLLMLLVTSIFGIDIQLPANPFFALSLATNVLVTALTAGRIWWICRQCRLHFKYKTEAQQRCISTVSILVESGVLYSATVLVWLIVGVFPSTSIVQEPVYQMLTQVMGIAPTLIIVRVGLGVGVQNLKGTMKTMRLVSDENDSQKSKQSAGYFDDVPPDAEKGRTEFGSRRPLAF